MAGLRNFPCLTVKKFIGIVAAVCVLLICFQLHFDLKKPSEENSPITKMFEYFHLTNSSACQFAVDFGFHIIVGEGVQAPDGHKAVCLDSSVAPKYNECLVYSFGINNEWTFDEAMATFGCKVYSFDPSMGLQDHARSERIFFFNMGLREEGSTLKFPKSWNMKSFSDIYKMLKQDHGPIPIDVLKMDIELSEWDVIPSLIESGMIDKIKQLAVEIHFSPDDTAEVFSSYYHKLKALEEAGFYRFSSRINPWLKRRISALGREDYIGFELAWYNSKYLALK